MKQFVSVVLVVIGIISASVSFALPRFALKRGEVTCSGCHEDPSGGGLRTKGGESFEINGLPMWKKGDSFTGQLSEGIKLGADFRSQYICFSQKMPIFSHGDSITPAQKLKDTTVSVDGFHAMSYAIELSATATKTLSGYLRYDLNGQTPTQAFALLHFVHSSGELWESGSVLGDAYIKFGAFLPTFGIRFDDHTVYSKSGTAGLSGFDQAGLFWAPGYRDIGAELGLTLFDHIGIQLGVYNGNEKFIGASFAGQNQNKAFCARIDAATELIEDALSGEIGASYYTHAADAPAGATGNDLSLMAVHLGLRGGPVSILAEYDDGKYVPLYSAFNYLPKKSTALTIEGSYHISQGIDGIVRFETYEDQNDQDQVVTEVKDRITVGAQWFPLRFLEVRPEYRIATVEVPSSAQDGLREQHTQTMGLVQLHFFF